MRLNRAKVNLSIDAIMFILMMAVAGIGFLIKYVLVPGFKRHEIYGKDIELYYWEIDRHQWGTIHLIVSLIVLFLLFLHIVFHWKQLVNIFKRMVPAKLGRVLITSGFVACSLFLAVMPLFIKPEIKASIVLHKNHPSLNEVGITEQHPLKNTLPNHDKEQLKHDMNSEIKVYGHMTLEDVADKYQMNTTALAHHLNIPENLTETKLGKLRKNYDFKLSELRDYIAEYQLKKQ